MSKLKEMNINEKELFSEIDKISITEINNQIHQINQKEILRDRFSIGLIESKKVRKESEDLVEKEMIFKSITQENNIKLKIQKNLKIHFDVMNLLENEEKLYEFNCKQDLNEKKMDSLKDSYEDVFKIKESKKEKISENNQNKTNLNNSIQSQTKKISRNTKNYDKPLITYKETNFENQNQTLRETLKKKKVNLKSSVDEKKTYKRAISQEKIKENSTIYTKKNQNLNSMKTVVINQNKTLKTNRLASIGEKKEVLTSKNKIKNDFKKEEKSENVFQNYSKNKIKPQSIVQTNETLGESINLIKIESGI